MKKLFIACLSVLFFGAFFIRTEAANAANNGTKKLPGSIVLSIPLGCDCTIPTGACYCIIPDNGDE